VLGFRASQKQCFAEVNYEATNGGNVSCSPKSLETRKARCGQAKRSTVRVVTTAQIAHPRREQMSGLAGTHAVAQLVEQG
jgi:hypothetical protein